MHKLWFTTKEEQDNPGSYAFISCPSLESARWIYDRAPDNVIWIQVRP